jgi:hypothetical protein
MFYGGFIKYALTFIPSFTMKKYYCVNLRIIYLLHRTPPLLAGKILLLLLLQQCKNNILTLLFAISSAWANTFAFFYSNSGNKYTPPSAKLLAGENNITLPMVFWKKLAPPPIAGCS